MTWLIGVDEAGYGPNLGPLAIAATAWRLPDSVDAARVDLYELLAAAVSSSPTKSRIAIADSKLLYKPGGGLAPLERAVLAACGQANVDSYDKLLTRLNADPQERRRRLPWHKDFDPPLPHDSLAADCTDSRNRLAECLTAAGVGAPVLRARLVFPEEFNELTDMHGTKGAALSHVTIGLVAELMNDLGSDAPIDCTLDKHGGRNRYAAILQHHFADHWIETQLESRSESRYVWGPPDARVRFAFCSKGERFLPAALASMTAKYLRELSMQALNAFWSVHVEGLKPTAGYPVDAKRYRRDIEHARLKLKVDDRVLWRNR